MLCQGVDVGLGLWSAYESMCGVAARSDGDSAEIDTEKANQRSGKVWPLMLEWHAPTGQVEENAQWLYPYAYPADSPAAEISATATVTIRIFNPARLRDSEVSWRSAADAVGSRPRWPTASWQDIVNTRGPNETIDGVFDEEPFQGSMDNALAGLVIELLGKPQFGLIWDGIKDPEVVAAYNEGCELTGLRDTDRYSLVERSDGPDGKPLWMAPQFWWPRDKSWCVKTGYDDHDSYLTCTVDAATRILESRDLEPHIYSP